MSVGLSNLTNNYYLNYVNQQRKSAEANNGVGFNGILAARATEKIAKTEQNFEEMLKTKYPEAKYHVMDAYKIPSGIWCRNDFPFEKFFSDEVDESILAWKPNGVEPAMADSQVQARLSSTLGKKAIIIPSALEEKMKNDPELAKSVMQKVEAHIAASDARLPGRMKSFVITFDENGEIANFTTVTEGGLVGPTEYEQHQFEAEQKAKQERREEYRRLAEESALKSQEKRHEINDENYQSRMVERAIANYTRN